MTSLTSLQKYAQALQFHADHFGVAIPLPLVSGDPAGDSLLQITAIDGAEAVLKDHFQKQVQPGFSSERRAYSRFLMAREGVREGLVKDYGWNAAPERCPDGLFRFSFDDPQRRGRPWDVAARPDAVLKLAALETVLPQLSGTGSLLAMQTERTWRLSAAGMIESFVFQDSWFHYLRCPLSARDWLLEKGIDVSVMNESNRDMLRRALMTAPGTRVSYQREDHSTGICYVTYTGSFLGVKESVGQGIQMGFLNEKSGQEEWLPLSLIARTGFFHPER